jgi:hypothetical protein
MKYNRAGIAVAELQLQGFQHIWSAEALSAKAS